MEEKNENKNKWLNIRLSPAESDRIAQRFKKTTFQTLSEYHRALLLGEPVTVVYRDRSMDDMLEELVCLRRELNQIGNNLNQAVRNINSAHGQAETRLWTNLLAVIQERLEPSIVQINMQIAKYADIWSQRLKAGRA